MQVALTREVPSTIAACELTHLDRAPIDVERARRQHLAYRDGLTAAGFTVIHLPEDPAHPDSVFVEDTAVVLGEVAVLTRPGASSRRAEVLAVEKVLTRFRPVVRLEAPARVDGGDVLVMGDRVFVGRSQRTNPAGVEQMCALLRPHGYTVLEVPFQGCLHLKSAATAADPETVLLQPRWVDPRHFAPFATLEVHPEEPAAANVLEVGPVLWIAAAHPRTREILEARGLACASIEADELAKAEAALTCCSLLFEG